MSTIELHVGDIGTEMRAAVQDGGVAVNLSSATVKQFKLSKPNGDVITRDASFVNAPGTDGLLKYVTVLGDLDLAGVWSWQVYIELSGGAKWHTDKVSFTVYSTLS